MKSMRWLAVSLVLSAGAAFNSHPLRGQQPASATAPASSKVWIGRNAEYEEFLRTAEIARTTNVSIGLLGIKHAFFKPGGLAAGAALRSIRPGVYDGFWESYQSEIAAYKIDRMLQLDMVPPTVERRIRGEKSSVQLWVENTRMVNDIPPLTAPVTLEFNRQVFDGQVFHDLVGNIDANKGNILIDGAWNFILIDFSRAFTATPTLPIELKLIDRSLFNRIKALDGNALKRQIGDLVEFEAIDALIKRRDLIVRTFEKLAKEKGEDQVFLPGR